MSDEIRNEELENTETDNNVVEPEVPVVNEEENGELTPEQKAKAGYIVMRYLGVTPPSL